MNSIQTGTPASDLQQQNFKNTEQNASLQPTRATGIQDSDGSLFLRSSQQNLEVKDSQEVSVLGVSSPSNRLNVINNGKPAAQTGTSILPIIILVVFAICVTAYILRRQTISDN